jgi:hypothetical protein
MAFITQGASPAYAPIRVPVYTVGVGDTTARVDVVLKNVAFNKVAYEGNQFPVRAQVLLQGLDNQNVSVSVFLKMERLSPHSSRDSQNKSFLDFDFQLEANQKGIQRYDVSVRPIDWRN